MGAATPTLAFDVDFNRDVLGDDGRYFTSADWLQPQFEDAEANVGQFAALGQQLQHRAAENYNWNDVARDYESLARRLSQGASIHRRRALRATAPQQLVTHRND